MVGVLVGVWVAVRVDVPVGTLVSVRVTLGVWVALGVSVGEGVVVGVAVCVAVLDGVAVGVGRISLSMGGTMRAPTSANSTQNKIATMINNAMANVRLTGLAGSQSFRSTDIDGSCAHAHRVTDLRFPHANR